MSDYIDRQAAIDALGVTKNATKYGGDHSGYDTRMLYEIHDALTGIPAADVVPVVHGEWIVSHIPDSILWECDQCGFDCGAHSFNFCPNCGAKMDGGKS